MLLQYPPEIQSLARVTRDDKPPPGRQYLQGISCHYNLYDNSYIHTQEITGEFYRLLRIHIHMAAAGRLVPVVYQPTVAVGFLHTGRAIGKLSGVMEAIEFRQGHYYIPLLLPSNNKDSLLELAVGDYEVTVILIEKKFEAVFFQMFPQLAQDIEKILSRNSSGLTFLPYPITPAMWNLLQPITRYPGSPDTLLTAVNFAVNGLILAIKDILDERATIDADAARIKTYMICRLNETHTAASAAQALGMSRAQVFGLVKQHFGMTFKDLLTKLRMERARHLLCDPRWKIRTIAEELGYKNEGHFSNAFLKSEGLRPSAYRKKKSEIRFDNI